MKDFLTCHSEIFLVWLRFCCRCDSWTKTHIKTFSLFWEKSYFDPPYYSAAFYKNSFSYNINSIKAFFRIVSSLGNLQELFQQGGLFYRDVSWNLVWGSEKIWWWVNMDVYGKHSNKKGKWLGQNQAMKKQKGWWK